MGDRTVSKIVNEVALAVYDNIIIQQYNLCIYHNLQYRCGSQLHLNLNSNGNFPTVLVIKKPPKSGTSFFYYKQTFFLVLMALVNANYTFISVNVGSMGRFSDANIFTSSVLAKKMNRQSLQIPSPELLPVFQQPLPYYVFVGDEAFQLLVNLMRPYPKKSGK